MDSSRGAANSAILDCLERAGSIGLHIDDLIRYLQFEERKQILPRLYDLQGRDLIERLPGQKWRLVQAGTPDIVNQAPIRLSTSNFVSYKNSLQEYCQKKHLPVPIYKVEREEYGFVATVFVGSSNVRSQTPAQTVKEAEQKVAFEALMNLQVLAPNEHSMKSSKNFEVKQKKKQHIGLTESATNHCEETNETYKSKLNEYIQRCKLSPVKYEVNKCPGGFLATAFVHGHKFSSLHPMQKRKQAEQNAAHVALVSLGVIQPLTQCVNKIDMKCPEVISASNPSNQVLLGRTDFSVAGCLSQSMFKNILQEYQQKKKGELPAYNTVGANIDGIPVFKSTVSIAGVPYSGELRKSKKEAEQSSAYKALIGLGILKS